MWSERGTEESSAALHWIPVSVFLFCFFFPSYTHTQTAHFADLYRTFFPQETAMAASITVTGIRGEEEEKKKMCVWVVNLYRKEAEVF